MSAPEIIKSSMRRLFESLDAPAIWVLQATGEEVPVHGDIADASPDSKLGSRRTAISGAHFHCMAEDIEGMEEGDGLIKDGQEWTIVGQPQVDHSTGLAEVALRWEREEA